MIIKIDGKELNIKFGYKPTLKERIISRVLKMENIADEDGEISYEKIEDLMLFLPELLLVGLQVNHKEYRYDCETGDGKENQLKKAFDLVEKYMESEDSDIMELFGKLEEALMQDSFLASLFRKEQKAEAAEKVVEMKVNNEN